MKIEWNKATWYSKWASIIFFIGLFPIIAFNLGRQYERTIVAVETIDTITNLDY